MQTMTQTTMTRMTQRSIHAMTCNHRVRMAMGKEESRRLSTMAVRCSMISGGPMARKDNHSSRKTSMVRRLTRDKSLRMMRVLSNRIAAYYNNRDQTAPSSLIVIVNRTVPSLQRVSISDPRRVELHGSYKISQSSQRVGS